MKTKTAQTEKKNNNLCKGFFGGMAIALSLTAVVFLLCAVLITYTDMTENSVSIISVVVSAVSTFIVGFKTASKAEKGGMVYGFVSALIYIMFVLLVLSTAQKDFVLSTIRIFSVIISLVCGSIGGILGINTKK